jgi:hypothetical protein
MSIRSTPCAFALAAIALSPLARSQAETPAEDLLISLERQPAKVGGAEVQRASAIAVKTELLHDSARQGSGRFALQLFDEARIVRYESSQPTTAGGLVWTGRIEGADWSIVNFAIHGDAVAASIRYDHELLRIAPDPAASGVHALLLLDEDRFAPCGTGPQQVVSGPPVSGIESSAAAAQRADVLVAYSPQARSANGGTNGMLSLINLAVTETNQSYQNSKVAFRLRLVHAHETPQSENSNMSTMLNRVRSTSDGWYDEVHALRDQYGADFVAMIVRDGQYCGIASLMSNVSTSFASSAFSVTQDDCATGYYSFGHEIGHNQGSHHDRANGSGGAYQYSYGYRTPNSAWRTVMAYAPGTRLPYFSSPEVFFQGFVMGIAAPASNSADNGRSIDNAAPTFSQFRCAVPAPYGTGMLTSLGAEFRLGWGGQPKANGTGNFAVEVSAGVPGKVGLLFYGIESGNLPFKGGSLYVTPPLKRLAAATLDAQGAASYDFFSLVPASIGEVYYVQFWSRDPSNPSGMGVALTNGLRVDVCQ